jgi:hypothetical protein
MLGRLAMRAPCSEHGESRAGGLDAGEARANVPIAPRVVPRAELVVVESERNLVERGRPAGRELPARSERARSTVEGPRAQRKGAVELQ